MFDETHLEAICSVLGDTSAGLTGGEISKHLQRCGFADPDPSLTKRYRLLNALMAQQRRDGAGNAVVKFIESAMVPAAYAGASDKFSQRREQLNVALAFVGIELGENGRARSVARAQTLSEAEQRANKLRHELHRRNVHGEILRFCRAELLVDNYFHAVLEASKSVADKLRTLSGCNTVTVRGSA